MKSAAEAGLALLVILTLGAGFWLYGGGELGGNGATDTTIVDAWYFGMRTFTATKPIAEPDDLAGLKIRVQRGALSMTKSSTAPLK